MRNRRELWIMHRGISDGIVLIGWSGGPQEAECWGIHDMHGNMREWCRDYFIGRPPGGRDPEGPDKGESRSSRGGSWRDIPGQCRSACHRYWKPDVLRDDAGFRVVLIRP